jgi:hypothetical protein
MDAFLSLHQPDSRLWRGVQDVAVVYTVYRVTRALLSARPSEIKKRIVGALLKSAKAVPALAKHVKAEEDVRRRRAPCSPLCVHVCCSGARARRCRAWCCCRAVLSCCGVPR